MYHLRPLALGAALAALILLVAPGAHAQIPGLTPPLAPAAPTTTEDPLKRDTPRSSFLGYISAAQTGNDTLAAEYLEWPRTRMSVSRPEAARQLMFALNHGFEGNINKLSQSPEGTLTDGLPPEKDIVGDVLLANGERVDIAMRRVAGPNGTNLWLIASETVAEIPRLHDESGLPEIERRLPSSLTRTSFGGLPVWVPLTLLALLPLIYFAVRGVLGGAAWLVRFVAQFGGRTGPAWLKESWRALSRPTAFLLTVELNGAVGSRIGIPIYHRYLFNRTVTVLFVAGLVWWLWRLQDLVATRIRVYLEANNAGRAQSAYIIGRRLLQGLTLVITVLVTLAAFGVDLSATLAGLGIGGLAIAFAAQKTLENVFAGISVLGDRSIVVGDVCQIGKYTGTVEDVGLRTMRLRTVARTVVHVPNGTLATAEVENFSRRDKFLLQTTLGLRYETTPAQLAQVLSSLRALLANDPTVEPATSRVRFVKLGPYSMDVEVFAYLMVPDYTEFLARQEAILARIVELVPGAGTGFAFPSQTLYLQQ
jgi:MscS family membrane protein